MAKVSVIIAAYNVENYICECLESVYNQTLKDIEIIVCDDCSTDNTLNLIKSIAEYDQRIKVVANEKNLGLLHNRKSGVDAATGDYIMFLDGDDYYSLDACEKAYNAITAQQADILQFETNPFAEKPGYEDVVKGVIEYSGCPKEKIIVPDYGCLLDKKYTKLNLNYSVFSKIYGKNVIKSVMNNLPNEKITLAEDVLISTLTFYHSRCCGYISDKLYNYRVGTGISTNKNFNDSKIEGRAKAYFVYTFLRDWLENKGVGEICGQRLKEIQIQMLEATASTVFAEIPKEKVRRYVETALKYCPKTEFLAYLSYLVYGIKNYREEQLADLIKTVDLFKANPKKVKTIGTFYHRMYNGGVEKVISQLSDIWNKEGYRVILFTDEEPNKDDYSLNENTVRVVLPNIKFRTFDEYLARTKAWIEAVEKYQIDTVVYHAWLNLNKLADISAIKSTGIPCIMHTHGVFCSALDSTDYIYAYRTSNLSSIYQCADAVIALTDVDASWWQSKDLRCYKTVNPIDIKPDTSPSELKGHNVIVSARIEKTQKQTHQAIEVAKLVKKEIPDVTFTFIGGCDDRIYYDEIKKMIDDYDLKDCVKLEGYVQNVTDYYQKADIMLSVSRFEGFSLALVEGKVCGLPLVSYFLANWDMARRPKGMVNVPQGDIKAAADEIVKILADNDYKKELGKRARESGLEYLSTNIGQIWNNIFTDMERNEFHAAEKSTVKEPLAAATDILVDFNARGIESRSKNGGYSSQEVIYYQMQCNALDRTIKEIKRSTAYKIGMKITAIPRKIKNMLKK